MLIGFAAADVAAPAAADTVAVAICIPLMADPVAIAMALETVEVMADMSWSIFSREVIDGVLVEAELFVWLSTFTAECSCECGLVRSRDLSLYPPRVRASSPRPLLPSAAAFSSPFPTFRIHPFPQSCPGRIPLRMHGDDSSMARAWRHIPRVY